ncbi:hypothetical protein MBRA1_000199 [Malassezia brasiliensis]|uniref:Proteasome assembly chaperone 2 n=1 Tax=Malassezia brasiliensis TaxID=1821822 RepID=A0AAF0DQH2_9BASI|nr:hypothetical protein MBRA1_000199 [Malassezia brasiliensis]
MSRPFCRPAFQTPPDFHGRTLVLPVVSVGSVPQLAVDLLIHAPELQCARVASLDGAECVPFVAPSEDGSATAGVYTALDVYQAPGSGLVIVQQRSPVLKSHKTHFAQRLKAWIEQAGFAEVLILASMDAAFRTDAEMHTALWKLRPVEANDIPLAKAAAHLPTFGDVPLPPIPGGGMARTSVPKATTAAMHMRLRPKLHACAASP